MGLQNRIKGSESYQLSQRIIPAASLTKDGGGGASIMEVEVAPYRLLLEFGLITFITADATQQPNSGSGLL